MDTKTLKALKGSIEKWERIVEGTGIDKAQANCPLCEMYGWNCMDCPVVTVGGAKAGCHGSPYSDWMKHLWEEHWGKEDMKVYCPTCKKLAQRELDFLKSLLPKER